MTGRMAGQTLNDRILAARHSIAGQGLAKSVCKATTEEMIGPKKKHLDYLIHCTNEPNISIPQLANLLIERSQNANWIVVYKALITVHNLMCYGNERFTQYLASSNSTFQLNNFLDKGGVQGVVSARTGYDMSPFIRRYARYLNEKALSYRTVAFDFCKIKRGKEDGTLRTMNAEKLLKTIPVLQSQLDALLEFDCSANDLTNGVINMCFMLLFRDLIRLFACYNDGIINLLEKYFDMNKKQCKEALDIYKKFLVRMDRVGEFLKVAENVGIDKGDIPDLTKAPSSLLEALEQHIQYMDGKKAATSSSAASSVNVTPQSTSTTSHQKNVRSGVSALSSTSSSFGAANGRLDQHSNNGIDENLKLKALQEEEEAINQFNKSKNTHTHSSNNSNSSTSNNNPFLSSTTTTTNTSSANSTPIVDLFAADPAPVMPQSRASEDLLQLSNPFADAFAPQPQTLPNINVYQPQNPWLANGYTNVQPVQTSPVSGPFVSESNFNSVFGNSDTGTADGNVSAQSFNPFLVDDPVPSLLLDTNSPTKSPAKPIQDVLDFFAKEAASDNIPSLDKIDNKCNNCDDLKIYPDISGNAKVAKGPMSNNIPPKRPPPPKNAIIKSNVINGFTSKDSSPETFPEISQKIGNPLDNNLIQNSPTVTANEETPAISQYTGGVLQPMSLNSSTTPTMVQQMNNNNSQQQQQQMQQSSALITGDLESSLASLAENLSINNRPPPVKSVQWNSPKNGSKPAQNWAPQPMSATTGPGYKPMNQSMTAQPVTMQPQIFPSMQPQIMGMRPMVQPMANPMLQARPAGMTATPTPNQMNQQSLLFH